MREVAIEQLPRSVEDLEEECRYVALEPSIRHLLSVAEAHKSTLLRVRMWLVSSTAKGGGVAEMLPRFVAMMRRFGVGARWLLLEPAGRALATDLADGDVPAARSEAFFRITKLLHNNVHGEGVPIDQCTPPAATAADDSGGDCHSWLLSAAKAWGHAPPTTAAEAYNLMVAIYNEVSKANAAALLLLIAAAEAEVHKPSLEGPASAAQEYVDVVIVHDPQPAGMVSLLKAARPGLICIWRCHIGLDRENAATHAAWAFLLPLLHSADACVFSAPEYVPPALARRSTIICPGIAPLALKNVEMSAYEVAQVLTRAGLMPAAGCGALALHGRASECSLVDPPFKHQATVFSPDGYEECAPSCRRCLPMTILQSRAPHSHTDSTASASESPGSSATSTTTRTERGGSDVEALGPIDAQAVSPVSIDAALRAAAVLDAIRGRECTHDTHSQAAAAVWVGFPQRPLVTQISRWDRLKGWRALLRGFAHLKEHAAHFSTTPDLTLSSASEWAAHDAARHRRMLDAACLVLAGPDPSGVADDPEGLAVLRDLKREYCALPAWLQVSAAPGRPDVRARSCKPQAARKMQRDVKIIELPMQITEDNAKIVNALQRSSICVVQNSLQEGFGLTLTEAMFKRVCVIGTEQAVGLRTQVRHGVDGILVQGNASDYRNVAVALNSALGSDMLRQNLAVNGQRCVFEHYLSYKQMEHWAELVSRLVRESASEQ